MSVDTLARSLAAGYSDKARSAEEIALEAKQAAETAVETAVEAVPAAVTTWLNANVNPVGSAVAVDSSLTISGAAADAKVTGEGIADLRDSSGTTNNVLQLNQNAAIQWHKAKDVGVRYDTGNDISSSVYSATNYIDIRAFSKITYKRIFVTSSSVNTGIAFYNAKYEYISGVVNGKNASEAHYEYSTVSVPPNACYVRCTILRDTLGDTRVFDIYGESILSTAITGNNILKLYDEYVEIPVTFLGAGSVSVEDGTIVSSAVYEYSDYVDVSAYMRLKYTRIKVTSDYNYIGLGFYDKNKKFLSGNGVIVKQSAAGYVEDTVAFPTDVYYVRATRLADSVTHGAFELYGQLRMPTYSNDDDFCMEPYAPMDTSGNLNIRNGTVATSSTYYVSDYIFCSGFDYIRYSNLISTLSANKLYGLSFYNSSKSSIRFGRGYEYQESSGSGYALEQVDGIIPIPTGADYVRFSYAGHETQISSHLPNCYFKLYKVNTLGQRVGRLDGLNNPAGDMYFRKPKSEGVKNAIRRMYQLSHLKWTPAAECARMLMLNGSIIRTKYVPGIEYTGVPYSPTYSRNNNVNIERSIETFESAVSNVKTRMFDDVPYTQDQYSYFGSVCSSYVSAALDLKCAPLTKDMPDFIWFEKIANAQCYNEYSLELGDILLMPSSHVVCVSGILCDNQGVIKYIEISEETMNGYIQAGRAISKWYIPDQLMSRFGNDYDLYRYKYIDTVQYNESDWSQVYPEGMSYHSAKAYCYPVFGNNCIMQTSSSDLTISVSSDAYTDGCRSAKIYQDGTLLTTETITAGTDSFTVPRAKGRYYICILDENAKVLDSCSWEVVSGTFSKSSSGNTATIMYNTDLTIYAIAYKVTGDNDEKYMPVSPVTGSGSFSVNLPNNASVTEVVAGNNRGLTHFAI